MDNLKKKKIRATILHIDAIFVQALIWQIKKFKMRAQVYLSGPEI